MFWLGHHRAFSFANRHSPRMLGWNLFLLGIMAFMPFATAFLAQNMGERVPAVFYCVTLLLAGLLNARVVWIATGPEMVDPAVDPAMIVYSRRRSLSVVLGAVTAILVGLFAPQGLLDVTIPECHVSELIRERPDLGYRLRIVSIFGERLGELDHLVADL